MSALVRKVPCLGVATLLVLVAGWASDGMASTGAGSRTSEKVLEEGSVREPAPITPCRGDLLLADGETLVLEGSHIYRRCLLGSGSELFLDNCILELTGDGSEIPSITGSPETLSFINSTVRMLGMNGTSRLSTSGSNVTFDVKVDSMFRMDNSSLFIQGGSGWLKSEPGAPFDVPLSGREFAGGNCTFSVSGDTGSTVLLNDSRIHIFGGNGSNAPDGEDLLSDDFYLSGGYTTGADLGGWVGSGGGADFTIDLDGGDARILNTKIWTGGGIAGFAGDAGGVAWAGEVTYTHPTTSGGYTSGGWKDGQPYDPGSVSGDVGSGGTGTFSIYSSDLELKDNYLIISGGIGGNNSKGGSCISEISGSPGTVTSTRGGGGGGGFSGGYGGYKFMNEWGGGDGGDIRGRVGQGGDAIACIDCSGSITMEANSISCHGGFNTISEKGGSGGGDLSSGIDGGGGGASGLSGGGGAPAKMLSNNLDGGRGGSYGSRVSNAGDTRFHLSGGYIMSVDRTNKNLCRSRVTVSSGFNGESGEVGATSAFEGGEGGRSSCRPTGDGVMSQSGMLPAPSPIHPVSGSVLTGLSEPFQWTDLDMGFYNGNDDELTFRLLGSDNLTDIIQEFNVTGVSTFLLEGIDDGRYFWTVKPHKPDGNPSWMMPQEFTVDTEPPVLLSGPGIEWIPSSNPVCDVVYNEDLSGLDPETVKVRHSLEGSPFGNWTDAPCEMIDQNEYRIRVTLPSTEGNYTFQTKASDRAGNGPVLGGPFSIGVDGSPPVSRDLSPTGWTGTSFDLSFTSFDLLSGISGNFSCSVEGPMGQDTFPLFLMKGPGNEYSTTSPLELAEGNYTIRIYSSDIAGNTGSSEPFLILVDGSSPFIVSCFPADGDVITDTLVTPSIKVLDTLSGPVNLEFHLEGPSGPLDRVYSDLLETVNIQFGTVLDEGEYTWYANVSDLVGNRLNAGPFSFIVDRSPPVISDVMFEKDARTLSMLFEDTYSGPGSVDVRCRIPVTGGFKDVWTETFQTDGNDTGGIVSLVIPDDIPDPVCYLSVKGIDRGGNSGEWSDLIRINGEGSMAVPEMVYDGILGPDGEMEISMYAPSGANPDTVRLKIIQPGGLPVLLDPSRVVPAGNSTLIEDSDLSFPVMIDLLFQIDPEMSDFEFTIRYLDAFPLPEMREWGTGEIVIDTLHPDVHIGADPFYTENPARVELRASDEVSELLSLEVAVGEGGFGPFDISGAPSLIRDGSNITGMLVNLSYGPVTGIKVKVTDEAGNSIVVSATTRATRAPVASMSRTFSGTLEAGREYLLSADCQDPDGDPLLFNWYVDGVLSGTGEVFAFNLTEGEHEIILNCTDGDIFVEEKLIVVVEAVEEEVNGNGSDGGPSLIWVLILVVLVIVTGALSAIILLRRRNDDGGEEEDEEEMDWEQDELRSGRTGEDDVEVLRCDICLKRINNHSGIERCRCGARFHRSCASREGECPGCGREIMLESR